MRPPFRQRFRPTRARILATLAIAAVSVVASFLGNLAGTLLLVDRFSLADLPAADREQWDELFESADEVEPHLEEVTDFVTSVRGAWDDGHFGTIEQAMRLSRWVTVAAHLLISYLVACFIVRSPEPNVG